MVEGVEGLFPLAMLFDEDVMPVAWSFGLGLWPPSDCCRVGDLRQSRFTDDHQSIVRGAHRREAQATNTITAEDQSATTPVTNPMGRGRPHPQTRPRHLQCHHLVTRTPCMTSENTNYPALREPHGALLGRKMSRAS